MDRNLSAETLPECSKPLKGVKKSIEGMEDIR